QHGHGVARRRDAAQASRGHRAANHRCPGADAARQGCGDGAFQHGLDGDPVAAARRRPVAGHAHRRARAAHGRTHRHPGRVDGTRRTRCVNDPSAWRPTASLAALRRRAQALATTREFFHARKVLEVETPALINAPVTDVNIGSVRVTLPGREGPLFLHTSPEYAMKRLLAAGSGDIYQLCHVFRGAERGRQHNPEFTLLEWYRLGFTLERLMDEVATLVQALLGRSVPVETMSYREALRRHAGFDPLDAEDDMLRRAAQDLGLDATRARESGRDELLDLIVGAKVGPALGVTGLTF